MIVDFIPPVFSLQIRWSVQQLLEGLRYLHQKNIAHLDVKVFVHPSSESLHLIHFTTFSQQNLTVCFGVPAFSRKTF